MPQVRFWKPEDLPHLVQMAATTAWNITPEDDKPHTSQEIVATSAAQNLYGVLSSPGGTAVVAEADGRPVGYLLIAVQVSDLTGLASGYAADIYVEPEHRRSGVSKELQRVGEEYLRGLGIRRLTNWTHAHNPLGMSASQHHGYQTWGLMMVKHLPPMGTQMGQVTGAGQVT